MEFLLRKKYARMNIFKTNKMYRTMILAYVR